MVEFYPKQMVAGLQTDIVWVGSTKSIVVLDGIPAKAERNLFLHTLASNGFNVFYPRYKGTWGSPGRFLVHSPARDIDKFHQALKRHPRFSRGAREIFLIGVSFGGAVALELDLRKIRKMVVLSPVLDFTTVAHIASLEAFLGDHFSDEYRFSPEAWKKLLENKWLFPLQRSFEKQNKKIKVMSGKKDPQLSFREAQLFARDKKISFALKQNMGHLSVSQINPALVSEIVEWFGS